MGCTFPEALSFVAPAAAAGAGGVSAAAEAEIWSACLGVSWESKTKKWRAQICCASGKSAAFLVRSDSEEAAARTFDRAAYLLFGEGARTNFGTRAAAADVTRTFPQAFTEKLAELKEQKKAVVLGDEEGSADGEEEEGKEEVQVRPHKRGRWAAPAATKAAPRPSGKQQTSSPLPSWRCRRPRSHRNRRNRFSGTQAGPGVAAVGGACWPWGA
jgi:hypothetical protein